MRPVSASFRRVLYEGNRNYENMVVITLSDNTELTVYNANLWTGGLKTDDNVSDQSSFTALGSAIINSVQIVLNNIYDEYSAYIFEGARVVVYTGLLVGSSIETVKLGVYTVDSASYNGALITLNCLDNMIKFDKPYSSSSLIYPATLQQIVSDACINCGVLLESTTFSNYTFSVATRPNDEALTYREVIAYAATLAGCFTRCNSNGKLELNWFDTSPIIAYENNINGGIFDADTPYSTGTSVDGGDFDPWNTGDVLDGGTFSNFPQLHFITALSSQEVGVDDIVITGIEIKLKLEDTGTSPDTQTSLFGNTGYVITVEDNPFITVDNVQAVGTYLQNKIVGLTFRNATISHLGDPSIEIGDVALIRDRKQNVYPILITNTEFSVDSYQRTICAAESPLRHEAVRFHETTKAFVESKTLIKEEATLREQLQTNLTQALNAKPGMYETRIQEAGGGYTYYLHDKPNLNDSVAVIKITNEAVGVTPNYQATPITWYGLTVDGNFITNIMSAIGIDFNWGTGGTLTLGGNNNVNGMLTMLNASGTQVGFWNNAGLTLKGGQEDDTGIFFNDSNNNQIGVLAFSSTGNYLSMLSHTNIDILSINSAQTKSSNLILGRTNPYEWALVGDDYTNIKRTGFAYLPSVYGDFITVFGDLYFASDNKLRFITASDMALLKNYYDGTEYNLIRSHNNGDVSVSASSGLLRLGYENTTGIDFFDGAHIFGTNYTEITNANNPVWLRVRNSASGNGIFIQSNIDGTVELASYSASGTRYGILKRANNSNAITAYGLWTFSSQIISSVTSGQAAVYASNSGTGNRIFIYADASNGQAGLYSYSADNTARAILERANNSNAITAYGIWSFGTANNTGIKGNHNYVGIPVVSEGTGSTSISYMASASGYKLTVNALWGGSTYGSATATFTASDIRLKEHIADSTVTALPLINSIRMREFNWKDGRHQTIGFIADELEELDKNLAVGGGYEKDGTMNVKSVDTFYLMGYLVKAVQELSAEIERLKGVR